MTELSLKELKDLAEDNEIDLSARGLTAVPKSLPQIPRLTHIDLGSNKITVLPASLCMMTRLVRLELGSNLLDHLPDNIGALVHLEHLDLYNNQIEELPLSFSNLNALRWLDLKKNPLSPELLKVTGNCGSEKECRQAALNVVSYMKELHKVHNIQVCSANSKFSQAREPKKEREPPKPVRTNRGFFSRSDTLSEMVSVIRFLVKLSLMSVVLAGLAATVGILLNCADGGKSIPGSKPLCADLTKLTEFKSPSPRFFANIQKTYGTVFNGYYARVQPTVFAVKTKWNEFHREFVKSDIGLVIDRYILFPLFLFMKKLDFLEILFLIFFLQPWTPKIIKDLLQLSFGMSTSIFLSKSVRFPPPPVNVFLF
ncbi:unnamed protein product [Haemonchus placei]|uniref:LRRCT domain-containing protein n=1 Tax=Haemonchus placei TaxID=6290 RepID=A0A0N4W691_HAEPC|nr:unnamed protein product [Haemonchus placei]